MRVRLSKQSFARQKVDLAACFAFEGDKAPRGVADDDLRRELAAQMKVDKFGGRAGDRLVWNNHGDYAARRFLILGLGKFGESPVDALRSGCARAARRASEYGARSLAIQLPDPDDAEAAIEARGALEGAMLGAYRFDRYITYPDRREVALEAVHVCDPKARTSIRQAVHAAEIVSNALWLARDLVNEGPSRLDPAEFARRATRAARSAGIAAKVLGAAELERIGMKALLAVSRGSPSPPRVVHLKYRPGGKSPRRIVLIGKGVTFDSGGLNLKPGDSMRTMKSDMAGAAAVLAAMTALEALACKVEVHAFLGLVENMTGGDAYKPGDILDTLDGKTVEVGNTDAEGRLVMCDLLTHAARSLKPDAVVDVATLTGACVVALGTSAIGVFSRHDELRSALLEAGARAGEKLWPLPMYEEYLQLLKRGPADLCNIGGRWGGAITAALFLGEFLPRATPWAHLDIAGPAFADHDTPETPAGGTGAAVRTLLRWLETMS